eukprot:985618-Pelagomonas_calceolata.AAC.1
MGHVLELGRLLTYSSPSLAKYSVMGATARAMTTCVCLKLTYSKQCCCGIRACPYKAGVQSGSNAL